MSIITLPGIYSGITNEQYHGAGLTPSYSLSSSGARTIEKGCLRMLWENSPLNPDKEPQDSTAFDIGKATHILLLEPHDFDRSVCVVYADSWRTKEAQTQREQARLGGLIPLLVQQYQDVKRMREAFLSDPICKALDFSDGVKEATLAWQDAETGVWLRYRPDFLPNHTNYHADVKTAESANPPAFKRAVEEHGYFMQAAWGLDAHKAVLGEEVSKFAFMAIEKKKPHLASVHWVESEALYWGRKLNRRAIRLFAKAMEKNEWPGYRDPAHPDTPKAFNVGLSKYRIADLERQEKDGVL